MTGSLEVNSATIGQLKRAELSAVVIRADGTVEDLGVIAATDYARPSLFKRIGEFLCRMF